MNAGLMAAMLVGGMYRELIVSPAARSRRRQAAYQAAHRRPPDLRVRGRRLLAGVPEDLTLDGAP